ncbi:hypothetical protein [Actinoplanes sp. NPDC026619]|uniref:hypothetical protein n=1 Tax=Actinoplanes sp. NPDC026619 TaxID=3155798 RepID=UPI0033CD668A
MAGIQVLSLTGGKIETHAVAEVGALLTQPGALVWVDIPECTEERSPCSRTFWSAIRWPSGTACSATACHVSGFIRISNS